MSPVSSLELYQGGRLSKSGSTSSSVTGPTPIAEARSDSSNHQPENSSALVEPAAGAAGIPFRWGNDQSSKNREETAMAKLRVSAGVVAAATLAVVSLAGPVRAADDWTFPVAN